jgi:hypothetical protein
MIKISGYLNFIEAYIFLKAALSGKLIGGFCLLQKLITQAFPAIFFFLLNL